MFIISAIRTLVSLFELVIILYVVLTYFLSPYHPVRQILGRFIEPLLSPIRRFLPSFGGLDFSPIILLVLVQLAGWLLVTLLQSLLF